jgi:hypothetical protein
MATVMCDLSVCGKCSALLNMLSVAGNADKQDWDSRCGSRWN